MLYQLQKQSEIEWFSYNKEALIFFKQETMCLSKTKSYRDGNQGIIVNRNIQKLLQLQLKYFNHVWLHNNPIIRIQRAWRQKLKHNQIIKKQYKKAKKQMQQEYLHLPPQSVLQKSQRFSVLKEYFKQWRNFAENRKSVKKELKQTYTQYPSDKTYLTLPLQQYYVALRNLKVENKVKNFVKYIKQKIYVRKMAQLIYSKLKQRSLQFNSQVSFYWLCGIRETKRFYFNRMQSHLLENFLIHLKQNFKFEKQIAKQTRTGQATHYLSIRTIDPQTFSCKTIYSVLTYTLWPSMKAIFLKKKKYQSKHKTSMIKIKPLLYIKNKYKILTKQQYKKSCKVYKQLQKFYKKQYQNSLEYFQCTNQEVMKMLLRYIYYHNSHTFKFEKKTKKNEMQSLLQNYEQPFIIYVDNILERTAAAVRIQQNWRKYLVNKHAKQSIYYKMKKTRAVLRIQRFWRDRVFYHRLSYQKNISCQLKLFNTNSFIIPQQIYRNFQKMCRVGYDNQLYTQLKIVKIDNKLHAQWQLAKPVFFPYIVKTYFNFKPLAIKSYKQPCQVWNILHYRSTTSKIRYGDKQFYQFKFQSPEQARYRIFLISLYTYKCRNSQYFLPLSRDTLDLLHFRYQQYQKMGLLQLNSIKDSKVNQKLIKSRKNIKIKDNQAINITKISILKNYQENGVFLFSENYEIRKNKSYKINVQFYQKVFQDFPRKYVSDIYYSLTEQMQIQKATQKQKLFEQLIQQTKISPLLIQSIKEPQEVNKSQQKFINVTKIDKKRLSFYDIGGKTYNIKNRSEKQKPKTSGQSFFIEHIDKRQNVSRIKMETSVKKQEFIQKKTQFKKKIRDEVEKERSMNATSKNLKQMQRTEQIRRKVERVKQMKNRVSSLRKNDSHQQDFIQQGNFVMQQQLKMMIMRSKLQSIQLKKKQKSQILSHKNSEPYQKSFYTEERHNQIKVFQNYSNPKPIPQSLGATLVMNTNYQNVIEGDEKKIVNMRMERRSKSRSIGAYLRDPSLVHGVFPEQYYPIDNKEGNKFKFLPPVL